MSQSQQILRDTVVYIYIYSWHMVKSKLRLNFKGLCNTEILSKVMEVWYCIALEKEFYGVFLVEFCQRASHCKCNQCSIRIKPVIWWSLRDPGPGFHMPLSSLTSQKISLHVPVIKVPPQHGTFPLQPNSWPYVVCQDEVSCDWPANCPV